MQTLSGAALGVLEAADPASMWGRPGSTRAGGPLLLAAAIVRATVGAIDGANFYAAGVPHGASDSAVWLACESVILDLRDARPRTRNAGLLSAFHRHLLFTESAGRANYPRRAEALGVYSGSYGAQALLLLLIQSHCKISAVPSLPPSLPQPPLFWALRRAWDLRLRRQPSCLLLGACSLAGTPLLHAPTLRQAQTPWTYFDHPTLQLRLWMVC